METRSITPLSSQQRGRSFDSAAAVTPSSRGAGRELGGRRRCEEQRREVGQRDSAQARHPPFEARLRAPGVSAARAAQDERSRPSFRASTGSARSRRSRRQTTSPSSPKASTVSVITMPGGQISHGCSTMFWVPSLQHPSPARCRRRAQQAEEREPGLDQQRARREQRGGHDRRPRDPRQDVARHDVGARQPRHPRGGDVQLLAHRQHRRAHQADRARRAPGRRR